MSITRYLWNRAQGPRSAEQIKQSYEGRKLQPPQFPDEPDTVTLAVTGCPRISRPSTWLTTSLAASGDAYSTIAVICLAVPRNATAEAGQGPIWSQHRFVNRLPLRRKEVCCTGVHNIPLPDATGGWRTTHGWEGNAVSGVHLIGKGSTSTRDSGP